MPLDDAIACKAVFVIVSASDGRTGGRTSSWSQLNNSKMIRDRLNVSMGHQQEPIGGPSNGQIPNPYLSRTPN